MGIRGHVIVEVHGPDGACKQRVEFDNLVTDSGDQMYATRGIGSTAVGAVTGMRLGTSSTAAAKSGAGAVINAYVVGSQRALAVAATVASKGVGLGWRATYQCTWPAGVASATITEAAVTNESPLTDTAGTAANTVARAVLPAAVVKTAVDSLTITWQHDLLGA